MLHRVYKTESKNGFTLHNIPYYKHEDECDDEEIIGAGTILKNSWLRNEYMPSSNINEFDYNDWTEEINAMWSKWLDERLEKRHKK